MHNFCQRAGNELLILIKPNKHFDVGGQIFSVAESAIPVTFFYEEKENLMVHKIKLLGKDLILFFFIPICIFNLKSKAISKQKKKNSEVRQFDITKISCLSIPFLISLAAQVIEVFI